MLSKILLHLVTDCCIAAILWYLNKASKKKILPNLQGEIVLRMPKFYNIIGYISLVIGVITVIGPFVTDKPDTETYILILAMLLLFGGLGALCILCYRNHYLLFDNYGVEVRSPMGEVKHIRWNDISMASFNSLSGYLILTDKEGNKLKIFKQLIGLSLFVHALENKAKCDSKNLNLIFQ